MGVQALIANDPARLCAVAASWSDLRFALHQNRRRAAVPLSAGPTHV